MRAVYMDGDTRFASASEAARWLISEWGDEPDVKKVATVASNVSNCANGVRHCVTAYGHTWTRERR